MGNHKIGGGAPDGGWPITAELTEGSDPVEKNQSSINILPSTPLLLPHSVRNSGIETLQSGLFCYCPSEPLWSHQIEQELECQCIRPVNPEQSTVALRCPQRTIQSARNSGWGCDLKWTNPPCTPTTTTRHSTSCRRRKAESRWRGPAGADSSKRILPAESSASAASRSRSATSGANFKSWPTRWSSPKTAGKFPSSHRSKLASIPPAIPLTFLVASKIYPTFHPDRW